MYVIYYFLLLFPLCLGSSLCPFVSFVVDPVSVSLCLRCPQFHFVHFGFHTYELYVFFISRAADLKKHE